MNPMIVNTSQGDVIIDTNFNRPSKNIMIRISGGADSAILSYMMAIYKRDYNPDINLYPMSCNNSTKPYQGMFASNVLKKVTELTGVQFEKHEVIQIPGINYREEQGVAISFIWKKHKIDNHVMGETMNPPFDEESKFVYSGGGKDIERDGTRPYDPTRPFRNLDKRGIFELYKHYNLLDDLFPLTRSCEIHSDAKNFKGFDVHCGECWFCAERFWGFGRYV